MNNSVTMEIKNNAFSRQFETNCDSGLLSVEYSFQEKKIFLTKINMPEEFADDLFIDEFLKNILNIASDNKWRVVPILPRIALFFKKNPTFKELLPPGIKI